MKSINRETFIAEQLMREHVRKRISDKLKKQRIQENHLRSAIRKIINEAETGTEEASEHTGINVLADLLKTIVPTIEDDYKMLTTSPEQRESFRNHMIHAVKNGLNPIEAVEQNESIEYEIDPKTLIEKLSIDLDSGDDSVENIEGDFIDIEAGDDEPAFGAGLEDQNETGRNFAAESYKRVEKQIVDAYDMLADDKDRQLFYDYLLTNLMLYFDKFEDELQNKLPDVSTPEYEKEKEEDEETEEASEEAADIPLD